MNKEETLQEKDTTTEKKTPNNTKDNNSEETITIKKKKSSTKKIIISMLIILLAVAAYFIYNQFFITSTTMDKKATKKFKYLTARKWVNEDTNQTITFSHDGKFSFINTDSGKAIDGFNKYTNYVYHNSKKLSIYGKKDRTTIDILSLGRNNLKILYNGKSIKFKNSLLKESQAELEEIVPSNTWYMCSRCDFVIMDYILYGHTTELTTDYINCYELSDSSVTDPGEKEGYVDHPLAKDIRFYSINAATELLEDDTIVKHKCILNKLTLNQAMKLYGKDKKDLDAYMFVNDDLEINKVIFFSLKLNKSKKSNMTESEVLKLIDQFEKQNAAFNDKLICVVDDVTVNDIDRFIDNDFTTKTNIKK